jgi:hypothetical protein
MAKSILLINLLCFWLGILLQAQPSARIPQWDPKDVEFMGWDYSKVDYVLSTGEKLELQFRNTTTSTKQFPLRWTLKTYSGSAISEGETGIILAPGEKANTTIELPLNLEDGHYSLIFSPETEGWSGSHKFYFDYRKARSNNLLNLELVAFVEGMDAEGWVRMMLGPLAEFCNVRKEFPADLSHIDAAIVIAEALDYYNPRFNQLRDYVYQGGTILIFGKTAPVLSMMLPVENSSAIAPKSKALYLKPLEGGPWNSFNPGSDLLHYSSKVTPKKNSTVLAEWSDGTPAVVSGKYGLGKVIYIGTGSYQVWQDSKIFRGTDELALRLLYKEKGGEEALTAMISYLEKLLAEDQKEKESARARVMEGMNGKVKIPDEYYVVSKDNMGRYGWLIQEGGLNEVIYDDGRVAAPVSAEVEEGGSVPISFKFAVSGDDSPAYSGVKQNWVTKTVEWTFDSGEIIKSNVSVATPFILWEGNAKKISIVKSPATHVAYPTKSGIKIAAHGELIDPHDITENWLLTLIAGEKTRDMPQMIVLTRRPESISFNEGLEMGFGAEGFGAVLTSRLYGIRKLAPGESKNWLEEIPEQVIKDARQWSRISLSYPVDCDEIGWLEGEKVKIADKFHFRELKTDWNTRAITMSPIPPVCFLAMEAGAPLQLPEKLTDLRCYTKFGPLKAMNGSSAIVYEIPLPPLDHRAIVPTEARMEMQDHINTNVRALELNTLTNADANIRSEGVGNWHTDLDAYDYSRLVPYDQAPQIDLYKWWFVFDAVLARPVYADSVRKQVDRHFTTRFWETINYYPHKSLVMQKREPWTNLQYMVTFIWPTQTTLGFRHFHDNNEASGVNVYC